jgi:glycosyltransferase involved in cell wall biosynthesis
MKKLLPVSVIIPIKDPSGETLNRLAEAISLQTAWPQEIVLVDTSNIPNSYLSEIFEKKISNEITTKIVLAENAFPGKARNIGIATAGQKVIAFLDLTTIPDSPWLERYFEEINQRNCDGIIGKCQFVGKNFFSWILIDGLFGRGPINSLPGSVFTSNGVIKIGPMLDKVRAGEDNEWLQRAQLMDVELRELATNANCKYFGFENITFPQFCRKWGRSYFSAATLPQYKLISQFNLIVWSFLVLGVAFNWNAFFAEWDIKHPMYLPHVSKTTLLALVLGYLGFRAVYLPLKRGTPIRYILSYRILFIFITVLTADGIKSIAFLVGSLSPRH